MIPYDRRRIRITHLRNQIIAPPMDGLWGWWMASEAYTETTGNPVTPASIAGAVGSLKDRSGNGRHLYQATAGNKPTLQNGTVWPLLCPVLRFTNAASSMMDSTGNAPPSNCIYSAYVVFKEATWGNNRGIIATDADSSFEQIWSVNAGGSSGDWNVRNGNGSGSPVNYPLNVWHILAGTCSPSLTWYNCKDDNVPAGSTAGSATGGGGTVLRLGRFAGNGSVDMDIAEVLFYNSYHGDPQQGIGYMARRYLNLKYNMGFKI